MSAMIILFKKMKKGVVNLVPAIISALIDDSGNTLIDDSGNILIDDDM
jgi:hypothetical protein